MVKHLYQPDDFTCGQTCVAMVAGVSVENSVDVFGHKGKTNPKSVAKALRKLGYRCRSKLQRLYAGRDMPDLCVAHVKAIKSYTRYELNKYWGRWVVVHKGTIYDPLEGVNPVWPEGIVIASYLEICGKRKRVVKR